MYIIECIDNSYYVGLTNNLHQRMREHSDKQCSYTSSRLPLELKYSKGFSSINEAIMFEKQIKGWSRAKKEALIDGDIGKLKDLSRSYGSSSSP